MWRNWNPQALWVAILENSERMIELKSHHFATQNEIMDLGNDHKWLLKPR